MVVINRFSSDTDKEIEFVTAKCKEWGVKAALSEMFSKGGEGGTDGRKLCELLEETDSSFKPLYELELTIKEKLK